MILKFVPCRESAAFENRSCYFPLVDSIASGRFHRAGITDQQLYSDFEDILIDEGHIKDDPALASWRLALAARESAPRIEAQYQLYRTTEGLPKSSIAGDQVREPPAIEVYWEGSPQCEGDTCGETSQRKQERGQHHSSKDYQFDRVRGRHHQRPLYTIYADLSSVGFPHDFQTWRSKHRQDAYRIRYKPSSRHSTTPLAISGYGVELALKRTDYIVIDDREETNSVANEETEAKEVNLDEGSISDLKPLSSSELRKLALNTASFVMASDDPFQTLSKISQDFPKHAAGLAHHNASQEFLSEHYANRDIFLRAGTNVIILNGRQVSPRELDAFSLLESMRRERKLVDSMQDLGLSPPEAVSLLQHKAVAAAQSDEDVQRYDFSDTTEGGDVIIWLNNIEKDKRYARWSSDIKSVGSLIDLQRNPLRHHLVSPKNVSWTAAVCTKRHE